MPRLALKDYEVILQEKQDTILKYMHHYGYDKQDMADRLDISHAAYCYKIKGMEKFNAKELAMINIILRIPKEERVWKSGKTIFNNHGNHVLWLRYRTVVVSARNRISNLFNAMDSFNSNVGRGSIGMLAKRNRNEKCP